MKENKFVKIVVFVDFDHADDIRKALALSGAGKMDNYDFCSFSVRGVGRFRPLEGSNPSIGEIGRVEEVEEERIEVICEKSRLDQVLKELKRVHPYEVPAIDIFELLN